MMQSDEVYNSAAEWGQWADQYRYEPTPEEEREARDFFQIGALDAFEEYICGLPNTDFVEVTRAIRTLRNAVLRASNFTPLLA